MINFNDLPQEIMTKIMNINKEREQKELWQRRFSGVVLQLDTITDLYLQRGDDTGDDETLIYYIPEIKHGTIRADAEFLEYNDLWGTSFEVLICEKHAKNGTDFHEWVDDYF